MRQDYLGDQAAKARSGLLLAVTSTGPVRRGRVSGRALPIASVLAVLTELAERADDVDRPFRSTIAQRVEGEEAFEAWVNFYTPLSLGLLNLPSRGRMHVLFEVLRHIRRENSAAGVEPLLASAINAVWPLLTVEALETVVAMAKRHIDGSSFVERHATSVSDATFNTTTFLAPGELQRIDVRPWIEEWRLQPTKNAWGMTDAAANDLLGRLGLRGGALGKWGGGGLPGSNNGDFGFGTPSGFGDLLGRLGLGGGALGKRGGGGLPGSNNGDFGFGTPSGFGDLLSRLGLGGGAFGKWGGGGLPGSNNGDLGYGTPGGFEGALGRLGLSRGPFGAFDPGANGGPTGFGAALSQGGAAHPEGDGFGHHMVSFATDTWKAVVAGSATINAAGKIVGGSAVLTFAGEAAAVAVVSTAGIYLVGSALAAAEDAADTSIKKASVPSTPANPAPTPADPPPGGGRGTGTDPKHPHEGDSYPDPDGSGGGPVDPKWIPAEDGPQAGGGHPLWSPASDGEPPPKPTMIWDENGGGGTPNTIGQEVEFELIAGQGLLAGVIQVGPRTFQFT